MLKQGVWEKNCESGACVEVTTLPGRFAPADRLLAVPAGDGGWQVSYASNPGDVLSYTGDEWARFVAGAKAGVFDV